MSHRTCGHLTCDCRISTEQEFCSQECRDKSLSGSKEPCCCGHDDCPTPLSRDPRRTPGESD